MTKLNAHEKCNFCNRKAVTFVVYLSTENYVFALCKYHKSEMLIPEDKEITYEEFLCHEVMNA